MSWADRHRPPIRAGDTVRYSAEFLRSIGCVTGDLPSARGVVTALVPVGEVTLAEVDWADDDIPARVNVNNLERCRRMGRG